MSPESLFSSTTIMLERMLDFQAQRHTVLSTNVANVDTPGYKGQDLRFSDELKRAIDTQGALPVTTASVISSKENVSRNTQSINPSFRSTISS